MLSIKYWMIVVIAFCIGLTPAGSAFPGIPEKINISYDKERLERGDLQVFTYKYSLEEGGEGKRIVGIMLINATPEAVWQVLEDWDGMGKYMPSLEYYKTRHVISPAADGENVVSYIEGNLKVAFLTILYTVRVDFDKASFRQEWELALDHEINDLKQQNIFLTPSNSLIRDIRGFEYIEPYGDGSKTIYYYAPIVEVAMPVPAWIERRLSKSTLNEFMEGVRQRAEEGNQEQAK